MKKTQTKMKYAARAVSLALALMLLAAVLAGCSSKLKSDETPGKGYFRDVDYGMSLNDVVVAEDERDDSGDPQPMTQFSCILYEHIKWDGYDCDVYYIANADGIHLDTILVNVNGGFNLAKTKVTFETLYTDGSKPEQSDNLYYTWSNGERMILCQSNADSTATITFMSADAIPPEEEGGEEGESK